MEDDWKGVSAGDDLRISLPIFSKNPSSNPNVHSINSAKFQNVTIRKSRKKGCKDRDLGGDIGSVFIPLSSRIDLVGDESTFF